MVILEGDSGKKGHEGTSEGLYASSFNWMLTTLCGSVFYSGKVSINTQNSEAARFSEMPSGPQDGLKPGLQSSSASHSSSYLLLPATQLQPGGRKHVTARIL